MFIFRKSESQNAFSWSRIAILLVALTSIQLANFAFWSTEAYGQGLPDNCSLDAGPNLCIDKALVGDVTATPGGFVAHMSSLMCNASSDTNTFVEDIVVTDPFVDFNATLDPPNGVTVNNVSATFDDVTNYNLGGASNPSWSTALFDLSG